MPDLLSAGAGRSGFLPSVFDYFNHSSSKPYDIYGEGIGDSINQGREYLNQANKYMQPFYDAGAGEMPGYIKNIHSLMDSPAFYNNMMKGYTMSEPAKFQLDRTLEAGQQAANATGMRGSTAARDDAMRTAQGITSQDQQRYYQNVMQPFSMGFNAQGGVVNQGQNAGSQMSNNTMNYMTQLMNAIQAKAMAKAMSSAGESSDLGGLIGGFGNMLGGGGMGDLGSLAGLAKYAFLF